MTLDPQTARLLAHLRRGGTYSYFWAATQQKDNSDQAIWKCTYWRNGDGPGELPVDQHAQYGPVNLYFGVNPVRQIPQERRRKSGGTYRPNPGNVRPETEEISVVNAIYAEHDGKDFGNSKTEALNHATSLAPAQSVMLDSGGGYQSFWLLDKPYIIDSPTARERIQRLQARWVEYAKGDPAAKDLPRVLRVPGTLNYKYSPPRPVTFVRADFDRVYTVEQLEAFLPAQDTRSGGTMDAGASIDPLDVLRAHKALQRLSKKRCHDYGAWIAVGQALTPLGYAGLQLWDDWSRRSTKYQSGTCKEKWETFHKPTADRPGVTLGSLFHWADEDDPPDGPDDSAPHPANGSSPVRRLLHASRLGSIPPTTWLIDGVLAMNKLSEMFAPPGSGKSFLELDKALVVAQNYPVIYVAAEAVEDYEERVQAWEQHHGQQAGQIYFWPEPVMLRDPASVQAFLTEIHPIAPAAIFIDPLASCMVGLEESSTGDMTIAVEALNTIRRETGAAVHVVHHTGWSDAHERGSSVLRAACRIVMKLSLDDSGLMTLSCEKANNGKPFEARFFRLVQSGPSAVPVPANKIAVRDAPISARQVEILEALDMIHFRDGATFTQIQEHVNRSKSTVNQSISRLMELGYILADGTRTRHYRLTEKGRDELAARLAETITGARTVVHTDSELDMNWTVNTIRTPHPDAEFIQFIPDSPKTAPVHTDYELNSSPEFVADTASECASSHEFIPSSQPVHSDQFASSYGGASLEAPYERTTNESVNSVSVRPWADGPDTLEVSASRIQELIDAGCSKPEARRRAAQEARFRMPEATLPADLPDVGPAPAPSYDREALYAQLKEDKAKREASG